jgi:hypothetical protein
MNRRNILSSSAITALGLIVLPGSTVAQQKSVKEQLVGTWTFVSEIGEGGLLPAKRGGDRCDIAIGQPRGTFSVSICFR